MTIFVSLSFSGMQAQLSAELERADGLREEVARLRVQAIAAPRARKVRPQHIQQKSNGIYEIETLLRGQC